jgi:four helix bundle protein
LRQKGKDSMLRIYPITLDWLKALRPLIAQIARHDRELAKQLRGSSSSVILNMGEGMYSRGGHRTNAYGVALREMGESYSALQAAQVHGYIKALEPAFEAQCRRILGTLVKLALPAR